MKNALVLALFLALSSALYAQDETDNLSPEITEYIEAYKYLAVEEQRRAKIPASIILAQGIVETGAGKSDLAVYAKNHFGLKCKNDWNGESFRHDDDKKDECFRKYPSSAASYTDHSNYLRQRKWYDFLFDLEPTDYSAWAYGLKKAGYATNPKYPKQLIRVIEKYNLQEFTYEALELEKANNIANAEIVPMKDASKSMKVGTANFKSKKLNGIEGFYAKKGENLLHKAIKYNLRYSRILSYNDLKDGPLPNDMFIYTKKKNKTGSKEFHIVQEGDDLHAISQEYGIQLASLRSLNKLYRGQEPAVGEKLNLKEQSLDKPILRAEAPKVVSTKSKKNVVSEPKAQIEEIVVGKVDRPEKTVAEVKLQERMIKKEDKKLSTAAKPQAETKKVKTLVQDPNIIDQKKAERVAKILGNPGIVPKPTIREIEVKKTIVDNAAQVKKAPEQKKTEVKTTEVKKEVAKKEVAKTSKTINVKKAVEQKKERLYNEKNVSNDVKDLKKRFDSILYREED